MAKSAWFIHGFVLFTRYGSKTFIGCHNCVNDQVKGNLFTCLFGGWWCFPWGVFTPIVLLQNAALLLQGDSAFEGKLREILDHAGVNFHDVLIGEDGLTGSQRWILATCYTVLAQAIWADGREDPRETQRALEILQHLTDGRVSKSNLQAGLQSGRDQTISTSGLSSEFRVFLFRIAADLIAVDGFVDAAEIAWLMKLAERLGIEHSLVSEILRMFYSVPGAASAQAVSLETRRAYEILGVEAGASVMTIRKRYLELCMLHHPDRVAKDKETQARANARMGEINWAYKYLLGLETEAATESSSR